MACHTSDGSKLVGPSFKGIYGHTVRVTTDGQVREITVDDEYLERSIREPNADIVIPSTSAGFEPLFAVYRKTCLPAMAHQLERDQLKIQDLFRKVRLKTIDEAELRRADPELISFFNVNTPEDLMLAENVRKNSKRSL